MSLHGARDHHSTGVSILQHQPDIALVPAGFGPRLGTGLLDVPGLDFAIELVCCVGCAWLAGGGVALYAGMVLFNIANLPTMLQLPAVIEPIIERPWLLPLVILGQIILTWLFVATYARSKNA